MADFMIVTTNEISGRKIKKVIGEVAGITVYSPGFKRGIVGGFSSILRGEVGSFSKTLLEARAEALQRLQEEAEKQGANAILMARFDSNTFGSGLMEVYAYGTAAVVE